MDSKAWGPSLTEAIYTDLLTATTAIHEHAKSNRYTFYKRESRLTRVIYVCDRYDKP
jgi:hypothetical protein